MARAYYPVVVAIRDIQRLLGDDFLEGLDELPIEEVRRRRDELQEAADELSYLRRLVQGRLDIVMNALEGNAPHEPSDVVEALKRGEILADKGRAGGFGRLPKTFEPANLDGWIAQELDAIAGAEKLTSLSELDDAELRSTADALAELERRVSEQRGILHDRTNQLQEEIVRRYKTGEASVESLLG